MGLLVLKGCAIHPSPTRLNQRSNIMQKKLLKQILNSHENIRIFVDGCMVEGPADMFYFLDCIDNHEIAINGFEIDYRCDNTIMFVNIKTGLPDLELPF